MTLAAINSNGTGTGGNPPPAKVTRADTMKVMGVKGLANLAGRIQEEYLVSLKDWKKWSKIILEMQDDVVIGTLLEAIKFPLLQSEFIVEAASAEDVDQEAKEFLEENMYKMVDQTWRAFIYEALEAIDFGFSVGEIVLEKREDGRLWLKNIEPRGQETLYRWIFDEDDHATHFQQKDFFGSQMYFVPLQKCVHIRFRSRKGNPQGKSFMRSIYRPWYFAKNLENFEGIGIERDVGGMPMATLPEEPLESGELTDLQAVLKGIRADEEAALIVPFGVEIKPYGSSSKMYDIGAVIARKQKEMLMRGFAQFLTLGMDKVGTQALVKGSQDFFTLNLQAVQEFIVEALNQQLVPFLFRFNEFPGITDLPKIIWSDPGKVDIKAVIDYYNSATSSGAVTPIPEDEEFLRGIADLPDAPDEEELGDDVIMPEVAINAG